MIYLPHMALTNDKLFQMRTTADFLRRIDDWRRAQDDLPSRSEAIRRLIELGLEISKISEK
jgi:hypothetical protein